MSTVEELAEKCESLDEKYGKVLELLRKQLQFIDSIADRLEKLEEKA